MLASRFSEINNADTTVGTEQEREVGLYIIAQITLFYVTSVLYGRPMRFSGKPSPEMETTYPR